MLSHCEEHAAIGQNRIIVSLRVRPFNEKESGLLGVAAVDQTHQQVTMIPVVQTSPTCEKIFAFDHVYGPETSMQEINHTLDPMIKDVFLGINGCVLGYGITGSGVNDAMNEVIASGAGKIFHQLEQQPKFTMKVSYYMILFQKIHDLLDAEPLSKHIKIRERKQNMKHKIVLEGGIELPISNMEEFANVRESGRKKRDIIITNMSLMSSRINQVMMINIYMKEEEEEVQVGKLNFVRCMGCQRIKKTGMEKPNEMPKVEATLCALSNVLVALSKGTKFVPYRDSSLTRILQPSLKNIMLIGNIAPSEIHYEQSLATLRFCYHLYKNSNKKAP